MDFGSWRWLWRPRFHLPVIAVLGSNGKTTVKELIAGILRQQQDQRILVTQGNQNNAIGLPLTLFRLDEQHQSAAVELRASRPGEIMRLGEIAMPNLAVITNAGLDHIAGFGGIDGAARANGEVFSTMLGNGIAVLNGDDDCLAIWRQQAADRPCLSFGFLSTTPTMPPLFTSSGTEYVGGLAGQKDIGIGRYG